MVSMVLVMGGLALVVMGLLAMDSFNSDVSRFFTGSPTDKSVWMFVLGIFAMIVGGSGSLLSSRADK
jgi:hypothetical protein